jgi:S-formylglutathione hydrolase
VNEAAWLADNPATLASQNADAIHASGLEIYLEVGDKDYINLHDGAEYLHRILWDNDIRHEYHLVRWADHVGKSVPSRLQEAHRFLAAALGGGLDEPTDLPLTVAEQGYVDWLNGGSTGAAPPVDENPMSNPERAASIHRAIWDPLRVRAAGDPDLRRAYAKLPPTA